MSAHKAIDICLIPDDPLMETVLSWNSEAVKKDATPVKLSREDRIPHLSLVMGVIENEKINEIGDILEDIAEKHIPIILETRNANNNWLNIQRTSELLQLHEALMNNVFPKLTHIDAKAEMFDEAPGTTIDPGVYPWLNDFDSFAREHFEPHITIWNNDVHEEAMQKSATSSRLVLSHLGNYNTVRSILWESQQR